MLKRFFSHAFEEDQDTSRTVAGNSGPAPQSAAGAADANPIPAHHAAPAHVPGGKPTAGSISFDQIYQEGAVKPPRMSYNILKVAGMLESPHLAGMQPEGKRNSVLMALEAAGVQTEDLLQDALLRQRALNDYEEKQRQALKEFEDLKMQENAAIQAELERLTKQHLERIQSNMDEVAGEQDKFHAWQRRKQQEAERIADAARLCVPNGSAADSLALLVERVSAPGR